MLEKPLSFGLNIDADNCPTKKKKQTGTGKAA